ncbi:MAG: TonB-dependent receptor plug domain-containing protein, partial [Bacteroidota bacterium]|nr:TonB-dependent receptor plug domain-containing protein [Bacteroidota bacterium]
MRKVGFAFLLWAALWAQQVTLEGKVTDETTQEPLIGAKVIINDGAAGALTDMEGRFRVVISRTEVVRIAVSYEGYEEKVYTLRLPADKEVIPISIPLTPKNTMLQEIVVSASRYEQKIEQVTVSLDFVRPRQIENLASIDPIKSLEQTPGVSTNKDQPSIRGSSGYTYGAGSRVLLLLDGLPMMSADRLSVQFDLIPMDNIKQIEIVKGASSVLYGTGALGGIIHVISEDVKFSPHTVVRLQHQIYDRPREPVGDWD